MKAMTVVRKVLAMPPTGTSWKAYNEEQAAREAGAEPAGGTDTVEVYLEGDHPRLVIDGTKYPLQGTGIDDRRNNAIQQVFERAQMLGRPVRVIAHEPTGSVALGVNPDGTMGEAELLDPALDVSPGPTSNVASALREDLNPFQTIAERRPSRGALAIRYLVLAVFLLFFLTGVRTAIWPYGIGRSGPVNQQPSVSTFPAGEAGQVAARFTTSYLTWDERKASDRAKAIELDLAAGLDTSAGWSGRGVQTVLGVYPGQVTQTDAQHGHVIVLARVAASKLAAGKWVEQPAVWRRLSVPVVVGPSRVVVSGIPAFVPENKGQGLDEPATDAENDAALTASTKADGRAFFTAYAASDEATAAITAPSAGIRSLQQSVQLRDLSTWTVLRGDSDRRTALATVTWKLPGTETVLEQDYRLTLLRSTAADGTQRWQVAAITNN